MYKAIMAIGTLGSSGKLRIRDRLAGDSSVQLFMVLGLRC